MVKNMSAILYILLLLGIANEPDPIVVPTGGGIPTIDPDPNG